MSVSVILLVVVLSMGGIATYTSWSVFRFDNNDYVEEFVSNLRPLYRGEACSPVLTKLDRQDLQLQGTIRPGIRGLQPPLSRAIYLVLVCAHTYIGMGSHMPMHGRTTVHSHYPNQHALNLHPQ